MSKKLLGCVFLIHLATENARHSEFTSIVYKNDHELSNVELGAQTIIYKQTILCLTSMVVSMSPKEYQHKC